MKTSRPIQTLGLKMQERTQVYVVGFWDFILHLSNASLETRKHYNDELVRPGNYFLPNSTSATQRYIF